MKPAQLWQLWQLCKQASTAWLDDYAPSMGAASAYYTMFSIAPFLLIAISVAGLVFGREAASGEVLMQLRSLMGESGALAVQAMLESAARPAESWTAALIGGALLLLGATTVFGELQDALDRIWRAQ
ncbi:YhjD/YihY/BrkB family envelope integrity protein [Paucibacter sp. Y2R2-4]|uniref:YhjD/YihY/BrkB family envelope integrity protein n=1 Tax=Paucibacter sp. Y2R2-4 TaxID=2893553 RepID=UPI0029620F4F|nr:YhjD/YihY/BrkB family envelope integrity protein [Paucibacter sp. Y2R2-4]